MTRTWRVLFVALVAANLAAWIVLAILLHQLTATLG